MKRSSRRVIPFGKPNFSGREVSAVSRVLRSGWVGMGPETIAFEKELARYLGVPHVVTVNSCTSALFLSLLVNGVKSGDEVICPSLTWCSSANSAVYLGARPVFCDVDPQTLSLTVDDVLARLTPRTRAVVAVHFGGLALDIRSLRKKLPRRIAIIEDAAHAFGSLFADGRKVGASGNLTCFSFYANKNLSTAEGGAIALFDAKTAERLRSLRQHALASDAWKRYQDPRHIFSSYEISELGFKMNYTDLQSSIGRVQLRRFDFLAAKRRRIARLYEKGLRALDLGIGLQADIVHPSHSRHLFVITLPSRLRARGRDIVIALRRYDIAASIHYYPLHLMPLYRSRRRLPEVERLHSRILTLPISASMSDADARFVVRTLGRVLRRHR